jgi:hypothetical protein
MVLQKLHLLLKKIAKGSLILDVQKRQNVSFICIQKGQINKDTNGQLRYRRYLIFNGERAKATVLSLETARLHTDLQDQYIPADQ